MGVFYRDTTSVSCVSLDSRAPRLQDVSLSTLQVILGIFQKFSFSPGFEPGPPELEPSG